MGPLPPIYDKHIGRDMKGSWLVKEQILNEKGWQSDRMGKWLDRTINSLESEPIDLNGSAVQMQFSEKLKLRRWDSELNFIGPLKVFSQKT